MSRPSLRHLHFESPASADVAWQATPQGTGPGRWAAPLALLVTVFIIDFTLRALRLALSRCAIRALSPTWRCDAAGHHADPGARRCPRACKRRADAGGRHWSPQASPSSCTCCPPFLWSVGAGTVAYIADRLLPPTRAVRGGAGSPPRACRAFGPTAPGKRHACTTTATIVSMHTESYISPRSHGLRARLAVPLIIKPRSARTT